MKNPAGLLLMAAAMSLAGTASAQQTKSNETSKPNIVLFLADDLDYADLSKTGAKNFKTPNIDSIANNGVEFTNAYVSCPVCGPSRVGILTGRYQDRIGYVTNHGPKIPENFGLPSSEILIPEMLDSAGYTSGMFGKWHLGFKPDMVPTAQGFDYFFGHLHGAHDYNPGVEKPGPILRNTTPVRTTKWLTTAVGDEAAQFVRDNKDNPYFLYVPFNAPHSPLQASEERLKQFEHIADRDDRLMAAMVTEMDDAVGNILKAIRETGDEENTLIVFFNDNGGARPNKPEANGPFRAGKMTVYEGGIRVPLFMQWKGKFNAGTKYEKPVIALDLAPTFLATAGTTTTAELEGVNLLPYIHGEKSDSPHESLFWRFIDAPNQNAMRKGEWKIVMPAPGKSWELYNLAEDIGETRNLAAEMPDKVKAMKTEWQEWNKDNKEPLFMDERIINRRAAQEKSAKEDMTSGTENSPKKAKGKKARRKAAE